MGYMQRYLGIFVFCILGFLLPYNSSYAYEYNSFTVDDLSIATTDTSLNATDTLTVTFTMPFAMTTSGYLSLSSPVIYSYVGGTYTSEAVDMSSAIVTSDQFSSSYQSESYISLTPTTNIAEGVTVTLTISGVQNPASIEGAGSFYVYGYEYGSDEYNYFSASKSVTYGEIDFTAFLTDADGTTPVSNVYVYVSYYGSDTSEYYSGSTDNEGTAYFTGLTSGRTYSVSFYYYGSDTTNSIPSSATFTYSGLPIEQ